MSITINNPVVLGGGTVLIGTAIPDGVQRLFRSVGVHNPTAAPITLQVFLVGAGVTADANVRVINRAVPAGKTDMCPELIGRGLNAGGTLQMSGAGLSAGFTSIDSIIG